VFGDAAIDWALQAHVPMSNEPARASIVSLNDSEFGTAELYVMKFVSQCILCSSPFQRNEKKASR
jgi:hypothetical protein